MSIIEDIDLVLGMNPDLFEGIADLVFPGTSEAPVPTPSDMTVLRRVACDCPSLRRTYAYCPGEIIPADYLNMFREIECRKYFHRTGDTFQVYSQGACTRAYFAGMSGAIFFSQDESLLDAYDLGHDMADLIDWQE